MDRVNSADSATFGFSKPNTNKEEQKVETTTKVEQEVKIDTASDEVYNNLEDEYTDIRSVTIALVKNYSLYRKANDKVLPKRTDYIGSSISSSRILASNKEEVEAYFPNIVGIASNNDNFVTRVKQHLNNIRIKVDELGIKFDISFHYYKRKDYVRIKSEEEKIEETYNRAKLGGISKLKAALQEKIVRLNALESTKHKYGYPINVDDYLMYRHCLLYNDIAKDVALINSDPSIRFYFKDDQKEADKLKKFRLEVNKAKANYVACLADDNLFDAIYIQYCVLNNLPIMSSLAMNRLDKEIKLDKFSTDEPAKFNKIFNNKDVKLMATIETLIARGELIRLQYNQNITTAEGEFIGANIGEAVAWFKDPNNTSVVNSYYNKLKNI